MTIETFLIMEIMDDDQPSNTPLLTHFLPGEKVIIRTFNSEKGFYDLFNEFELYLQKKIHTEELLQKIILSTIELVNNALEHGNKNNEEKNVTLAYFCDDYKVKIAVQDEGAGFNPDELSDPRDDSKKELERGRGIFIVKTYMDELHFNESANTLTIIHSLS